MVKKTAKTPKTNIQRAREEQWKRRVAAQGGLVADVTAGATLDRADSAASAVDAEGTYTPRTATTDVRSTATSSARSGAMARSRTGSAVPSASQRRMAQPARAGRLKVNLNMMSIDEEMHYVRSDIKLLILLTVICLVVLIALSFVIR